MVGASVPVRSQKHAHRQAAAAQKAQRPQEQGGAGRFTNRRRRARERDGEHGDRNTERFKAGSSITENQG